MKTLLAIDESPFSAAAAREAERRLSAPDNQVRVLHVVGTFVPPAAAVLDSAGSLDQVHREVANRYQMLVSGVAESLKRHGISAEGVVREGEPSKTIIREAREWEADLIIVGAHGLTGLESIVMGNVARYVVDHAPCSVEVVRSKKE